MACWPAGRAPQSGPSDVPLAPWRWPPCDDIHSCTRANSTMVLMRPCVLGAVEQFSSLHQCPNVVPLCADKTNYPLEEMIDNHPKSILYSCPCLARTHASHELCANQ